MLAKPYQRTRTAAPTVEPVSTADAKLHCRITDETTDAEVAALVAAARDRIENECEIALVTQTWVVRLDGFEDEIEVPRPPQISVSSVTYVDTAGTTQTLAASYYTADTYARPGRIRLAYGQSWPATRDVANAVAITYTAGFGATAASVPPALVHAVKLLVGHYHENREAVVVGTIASALPESVMSLIAAYRVPESL